MRTTKEPDPFFLRRREAASYLGVSQAQLIRRERAGVIAVHAVPGIRAVRYVATDVRSLAANIVAGRLSTEPLTAA
jgi:hypothetical protein